MGGCATLASSQAAEDAVGAGSGPGIIVYYGILWYIIVYTGDVI